MKKAVMAVALALSALSIQSALAAEYSEKTQYLGVVNGHINFISSYAFFIFIWNRTFLRNITIR